MPEVTDWRSSLPRDIRDARCPAICWNRRQDWRFDWRIIKNFVESSESEIENQIGWTMYSSSSDFDAIRENKNNYDIYPQKLLSTSCFAQKIILIGIISKFFPTKNLHDKSIRYARHENQEGVRWKWKEKLIFLLLFFVSPFITKDVR